MLILACILIGLVGIFCGYIWYLGHVGQSKLQETLAELDRTEPGWRWDQLQQARKVIPDQQNSAFQVLRVTKLLPSKWGDTMDEALQNLGSAEVLSESPAGLVEAEMAKLGAALQEARRLVEMPTGRFPEQHGPNPLHLLFNHVQNVRQVSRLLALDAIAQAQKKDMDAAILAVHAGLNASRSIGDELTLIAQLVRLACSGIPIRRLERVLAQGEAGEASLATLQKALEEDEAEPLFHYAVRGERAFLERTIRALQTSPESFSENTLALVDLEGELTSSEKYKVGSVDFELVVKRFFEEGRSSQYADLLRGLTEAVAIAKLPVEDQRAPLQTLEASTAGQSRIVRSQMPAFVRTHEAILRSRAEMRAAITAVAAERFRMAHGRWPGSLTELVDARLLPKSPLDPYTKDPLFFHRVSDGLIIYAVGADRKDDGGKLVRGEMSWSSEHDVGFRLWDVKHRRQPPKPKVPPSE